MRTTVILFVTLLGCAATARAVKTERWETSSPQEFMRGKLNRLTVTSDGELRLGYGSTKLSDYAKEIWCSAVGRDGTIWFGTGSPADVTSLRVKPTTVNLWPCVPNGTTCPSFKPEARSATIS